MKSNIKKMMSVLVLLSAMNAFTADNAFAVDSECLNRIQEVMQSLNPEAVVTLSEGPSESVVDRGLVYQMTKVQATLTEDTLVTLKTVIVYERPASKCMIRDILPE